MGKYLQRRYMIVVGLILLTFSIIGCLTRNEKPNVLFIFADQFRAQALGVNNEDPVMTPNLDRLASEGIMITHALSNTPLCSPYRAMLMTGKTPLHNRIRRNCWPDDVYDIRNTWEKTDLSVSDIIAENGYDAGYIGKLHLIAADAEAKTSAWTDYAKPDEKHGFNFWYVQSKRKKGQFENYYYVNDAPPDQLRRVDEWASTYEADVIIDYLHDDTGQYRDAGKPFMLFWSPLPPHGPLSVSDEYLDMYNSKSREELLARENVNLDMSYESDIDAHRKYKDSPQLLTEDKVQKYFAMVTALDFEIGRVLTALKDSGLEENTIVVFTSDHGEMLGSHGHVGKYVWLNESLRVPFIMRWPGKIPAGKRRHMVLNAYDIMPTLLGMVGLTSFIPEDIDGMDCSGKILTGNGASPDFGYYFKIGRSASSGGRRGIRTLTHTYVVSLDNSGGVKVKKYLYDDVNDPMQMNNLAGQSLNIELELDKKLITELEKSNDPFVATYAEAAIGADR
jgi:uncharacterized sulfatase